MFPRTSHRGADVLVRRDDSRSLQLRKGLADLPVLWQPVEVCPREGDFGCMPSRRLHSAGGLHVFNSPTAFTYYVCNALQLPNNIREFIGTLRADKKQLLAYCQRELFHAVWRELLDAEFIEAYKHGLVIRCADGVLRRVYPRIFTYSADYPEKYALTA